MSWVLTLGPWFCGGLVPPRKRVLVGLGGGSLRFVRDGGSRTKMSAVLSQSSMPMSNTVEGGVQPLAADLSARLLAGGVLLQGAGRASIGDWGEGGVRAGTWRGLGSW